MAIRIALRALIASMFTLTGAVKLWDLQAMRISLSAFGVPTRLVKPTAILLPLLEMVVGAAVATERRQRAGLRSGIGLLSVFTGAIAWNLVRGRRPQCNCFGAFKDAVIGWQSLVRNALIIGVSWLLLLDSWKAPFSSRWRRTSLIWMIVILVIGLQGITIAWFVGSRGRKGTQGDTDSVPAGIPLDSLIPSIGILDADGKEIGIEDAISSRNTLVYVLSSSCQPCLEVLTIIKDYVRAGEGGRHQSIIILPERDVRPHHFIRLFNPGIAVFQARGDVYAALSLAGTPAALALSSEGRVLRATAIGAHDIACLVDWLRQEHLAED